MVIKDQKTTQSTINNELSVPYFDVLPAIATRDGSLAYQTSDKKLYVWKVNQWVSIFDAEGITLSNDPIGGNATFVNNSPQTGPNFVIKTLSAQRYISLLNGPDTVYVDCTALDSIPTQNWKAGTNSIVGDYDNVVIGDSANNTGSAGGVLIGSAAQSLSNTGCVTIGHNSSTAGADSVALGSYSASHYECVAIGTSSLAIDQGVAIGFNSSAMATNCVSVGYESNAETESTAIGFQAKSFDEGVAIGKGATNTSPNGSFSVAVGHGSTTSKARSVAVGHSSTTGEDCVGIGYMASASADKTVVVGSGASANATDSVIVGYQASNSASSIHSVVVGSSAAITGGFTSGVAVGYDSTVSAEGGTALGALSSCQGVGGLALGYGANVGAGADSSIAIGYGATVTAPNAVSLGVGVLNSTPNTTLIGNSDSHVVNSSGFFKSVNQYGIHVKNINSIRIAPSTMTLLDLGSVVFATNSADFVPPTSLYAPFANQVFLVAVNFWMENDGLGNLQANIQVNQFGVGPILKNTIMQAGLLSHSKAPFSCAQIAKTGNTTTSGFNVAVENIGGDDIVVREIQMSLVRLA